MNNQAFSKIWIPVILVAFIGGGILAWQYLRTQKEVTPMEEITEEVNEILKRCQSIQDNLERAECWWNVRLTAKDERICEIIPEPEYLDTKYACYYEVALLKKDINLCEKSGHFKESCRAEIAEAIKTYTEEVAERIIKNRATEAILAIKNKDQEKLSSLAHPDKGIRFSPYAYVCVESNLVFSPPQLLEFFKGEKVYTWGAYDGSGFPINLTPAKYYDSFIYDKDFANAEEISYNRIVGRGNTINNAFEVYPNAIIVEYHFSGFDPKYAGMDWRSLRLVFEEKDNVWYLIGIIHDEWTI